MLGVSDGEVVHTCSDGNRYLRLIFEALCQVWDTQTRRKNLHEYNLKHYSYKIIRKYIASLAFFTSFHN